MQCNSGLTLRRIRKSDPELQNEMSRHYSQPRGFVGRQIFYAVEFDGIRYGSIVAGSACAHLPGRDEFMSFREDFAREHYLDKVINNVFFHIEPKEDGYPLRNFAPKVIEKFREVSAADWWKEYYSIPIGFESLVELPRTGECYKRDGWTEISVTKGETCKRLGGKGTDAYGGRRVWDKINLRPKRVFCKLANLPGSQPPCKRFS